MEVISDITTKKTTFSDHWVILSKYISIKRKHLLLLQSCLFEAAEQKQTH